MKIPKIITHIPAFIITENNVTNLLFEPDASNWIKKKVEIENNASINDWDPSAMCGFSDNFSSIENPNGMNKDFAFIENGDMKKHFKSMNGEFDLELLTTMKGNYIVKLTVQNKGVDYYFEKKIML